MLICLTGCPFDFLSAGLCLSGCPSVPGPHVQLSVCEPQGAVPQEALPSGGLSRTFILHASLYSWPYGCPTAMLARAVQVTPPTPSVSAEKCPLANSFTTLCSLEEFEYLHGHLFVFSRAG